MVTEIELKAHVENIEKLEHLLFEKAEFLHMYEKDDCYWVYTGNRPLIPSRIRIRRETRTFPGGRELSFCLATYKSKEVQDGVEINQEHEFEVKPAPEFEEFLKSIGFAPELSKKKQGRTFFMDGINAELTEVENLGWFVELELTNSIEGEPSAETIEKCKQRLFEALDKLGIGREAIESRFYSEMLQHKVAVQEKMLE